MLKGKERFLYKSSSHSLAQMDKGSTSEVECEQDNQHDLWPLTHPGFLESLSLRTEGLIWSEKRLEANIRLAKRAPIATTDNDFKVMDAETHSEEDQPPLSSHCQRLESENAALRRELSCLRYNMAVCPPLVPPPTQPLTAPPGSVGLPKELPTALGSAATLKDLLGCSPALLPHLEMAAPAADIFRHSCVLAIRDSLRRGQRALPP